NKVMIALVISSFFFQAEDGIRGRNVTGVQTCALPICVRRIDLKDDLSFILSDTVGFISKLPHNLIESFKATLQEAKDADLIINRSEERRVGKECRSRRGASH